MCPDDFLLCPHALPGTLRVYYIQSSVHEGTLRHLQAAQDTLTLDTSALPRWLGTYRTYLSCTYSARNVSTPRASHLTAAYLRRREGLARSVVAAFARLSRACRKAKRGTLRLRGRPVARAAAPLSRASHLQSFDAAAPAMSACSDGRRPKVSQPPVAARHDARSAVWVRGWTRRVLSSPRPRHRRTLEWSAVHLSVRRLRLSVVVCESTLHPRRGTKAGRARVRGTCTCSVLPGRSKRSTVCTVAVWSATGGGWSEEGAGMYTTSGQVGRTDQGQVRYFVLCCHLPTMRDS